MKRKRKNECSVSRFKRFSRKSYSAFNSMHRIVNIGVLTCCTLTFAHVTSTSAQTVAAEQQPEKLLEEKLEEVTVTASRTEMPVSQAAKLVTVITKAQIEKAPVRSIQDLLTYAAHIDVIQRGGHGVQADISIRGGSADQTAILLNGINLTNPHTGHYSFDIPVSLSDIERIEIVHGPSALIYGSGAFSGGINIITKKEADTRIYAQAEAGMHGLYGMEARGTVAIGSTDNSLSVSRRKSDGYMANSDYSIYNMLWQTRLTVKEKSFLDVQLGYSDKKYGANTFYSALYPNQYERLSTLMGTVKGSFGNLFKIIPILYWDRHYDQFDLIKDTDTGRNYHRGDTYGANLIFQYKSRLGITNLGGELRREEILSSNLGLPMARAHGHYTHYDERTNTSISLEHTANLEYFVASAGVLMSRNTIQQEAHFYPSVSLACRPNDVLKVYATWSQSSRMPTFTDLYYTTETHLANEKLKSERSESIDLGIKYNHQLVSVSLAGYLMWGRNIIDWVRESGDAKWASWNLTELDKQGIEAGLTFRPGSKWPSLERTTLALNYARTNQTCDSRGLESRYSLNYLRDKCTVQLNHSIYRGLSANWYFRVQKRMGTFRKYEDGVDMGQHPYPAFSTADLKLNCEHRQWNFYLNLNNLYDTHYYDTGNVPQAGFWLTAGVGYTLK
ncbi:MAG: TonB-dependent receptor [Tannerella sp.]|jgi:iron complex outermembrane receptor protein|nr:TonB-dependent receptor [Tannerella sp.]